MKPKQPLYTLLHGIQVIGEYAPRGKNLYWRIRIRPHPFFPGVPETSNGILMRRSRVILAAQIGRALTRQEHAHHGDDGRDADTLDNLKILSATEHNRHHKTGSTHRADSRAKTSASLKRAYAEGRKTSALPIEQRGEKNPSAKLTRAKAEEIRSSAGTHTALAARYGVSRRNIGMIKQGVTWK